MKNILKNLIKTIALCLLFLVATSNAIFANGNQNILNEGITQVATYEDYYNQFYQFYLNLFNLLYANANTGNTQATQIAVDTAVNNATNLNNNNVAIKYAEQDDTEFDISYTFKEDEFTGPGIGIIDDTSLVYNDGGPGIIANGFTATENSQFVDNGPQVIDNNCSPSDYLKYSTMKPGDFTFNGSGRKDKLNK